MIPSSVMRQKFLDASGNPLVGGKLYSYAAGTTTPQASYSDSSGTSNSNPVILDSSGEANVWLDPTLSYKFVLKDSTDVTQWTVDNFSGLLADGIVTAAKIASSAVTTAKIADDAVTAAKLADDAVTDANRAVTTNHIRDAAITAVKLASATIDNSTLENTGTTVRIKDAGVTQAKLAARATGTTVAAGGFASSTSSGLFTTSSTSDVDVTNLSVTITTTGRPVMLMLKGASGAYLGARSTGTANQERANIGHFSFVRGATSLPAGMLYFFGQSSGTTGILQVYVPPSICFTDAPAAGTYTYKVQARSETNTATTAEIAVNACTLVAFEL